MSRGVAASLCGVPRVGGLPTLSCSVLCSVAQRGAPVLFITQAHTTRQQRRCLGAGRVGAARHLGACSRACPRTSHFHASSQQVLEMSFCDVSLRSESGRMSAGVRNRSLDRRPFTLHHSTRHLTSSFSSLTRGQVCEMRSDEIMRRLGSQTCVLLMFFSRPDVL